MNFSKMMEDIKRSFSEERIECSKQRFKKIWDLEIPKDRIPFVFYRIPDDSGVNLEILTEGDYDVEEFLYYNLYQINERAILDDDYIPSFAPGIRLGAVPCSFGGIEKKIGNHYWPEAFIKKPEDVYKLEEPDFTKKNTPAWKLIENIKYCRKITKGELPIHIADSQSPADIAMLMWDVNDYLVAMYTNPDEVHYLHDILTKAFIKYIDLQIEAAEGDIILLHFSRAWMPKEKGISMSSDILALISPNLLKEFIIPYDERISDHYGGLTIHSCGNYNWNLPVLKKIKKFRALNFSISEINIKDIINIFGNSILYIPHSSDVKIPPLRIETPENFIKKISVIIKENNLPALVYILPGINGFSIKNYRREDVLELNSLALKKLSY